MTGNTGERFPKEVTVKDITGRMVKNYTAKTGWRKNVPCSKTKQSKKTCKGPQLKESRERRELHFWL